MHRQRKAEGGRLITSYEHDRQQRANNPPVGLVTPATDPDLGTKKQYVYDPHLDPQLVWAGKAERTSFEVPTVSLHVHERIEPRTIIEAVRKTGVPRQVSFFDASGENPPIRQAIDFYKHAHGWSNRLIAGDSLLVMNSLLEKEGMAGKVQMVYIDPPYGVKYGSNFQPFVGKRNVTDGKDDDLTAEPEQVKAFRDTWELGVHSYLGHLRDRLLLARELLDQTGGLFLQMNAENQHWASAVASEVFGPQNLIANIIFRKKSIPLGARHLETMHDHLLFFAKDKSQLKYRHLYEAGDVSAISSHGPYALFPDGSYAKIDVHDFQSPNHPKGTRYYRLFTLIAPSYSSETDFRFEFEGKSYSPPSRGCWVVSRDKLEMLARENRLQPEGKSLSYRLFFDDFPYKKVTALWSTVGTSYRKIYAVQTAPGIVERCLLLTTDPGDLVLDPTCGSGTTAYVAEQWGRRWITCDTSRVAIALAKQRLMTSVFDYYQLLRPNEGISSGLRYRSVQHVTLKSIANAEPPGVETLYDQPIVDKSRTRVTGPFTVEAVPAPAVRSIDDLLILREGAGDTSVARSGETLRQGEWRDELRRTGIRGKGGHYIQFARLEPLPGCRWLHADGETKPAAGNETAASERTVVSFGPEHAPLEQRQVALAIEEAQKLVPRPKLIVFSAFQFDPEAAKDIDETNWPGVTLLKAQMNADLLTEDLKKKRASNESFWLIGQPDVDVERITSGEHKGKYHVSVHGFDYYDPRTGGITSGSADKIAMWMLDTDYDGRSAHPRQVFFPMADDDGGWSKLARSLRAEIDQDLIEAYRGTESLPFDAGVHGRIAVKIVDDRGIESLKVIALEAD